MSPKPDPDITDPDLFWMRKVVQIEWLRYTGQQFYSFRPVLEYLQ